MLFQRPKSFTKSSASVSVASLTESEGGAAIIQVIMISVVMMIFAVAFMEFMKNGGRASMTIINRNNNLSLSKIVSDNINDTKYLKDSAMVLVGGTYP
jgi:hypothetical protein